MNTLETASYPLFKHLSDTYQLTLTEDELQQIRNAANQCREMNTPTPERRQYKDADGNPIPLISLVRLAPEWAANQIRHRDILERERDEFEKKMLEARGERNCLIKVADAYHKCLCSVTTGSEVGEVIQAYNQLPHVIERNKRCTCGEPHVCDMVEHRYDGQPCYFKERNKTK